MALPISVTYTFATATSAIPLSQLDANFTTCVNGINGIGNGTNALSNVSITGGNATVTTVNATTLNAATLRSDTTLTFKSNVSTTAMTINASQNVGIGTTSPAYPLDVYGVVGIKDGESLSWKGGSQLSAAIVGTGSSSYLTFWTSVNERMRIDASGNLLVAATSQFGAGRTCIYYVPGTTVGIAFLPSTDGSGPTPCNFLNAAGASVGSITTTGAATLYNVSSDYRLKNSIVPMTTGLGTIAALRPVTYKWNADNSNGEGFIAHELQAIIPNAVTGEKDAIDADGKPKYQGVDNSKIVVHLVAAIQELTAKVAALEAK